MDSNPLMPRKQCSLPEHPQSDSEQWRTPRRPISVLGGLFSCILQFNYGHCHAPGFSAKEMGAKNMAEDTIRRELVGADEMAGEVRLWQAVVIRAIQDWISGPTRQQRQAERYIFGDKDFAMVCQSAGLNADDLRTRLSKIRSQHLHEQQAVAA
jgi:hypothetical protein